MNAITPENEIPPAQSTAASGTLPIEHTNERTATSGPTITFSGIRIQAGASVRNSALKKPIGRSATKPAIRNPAPISFQSISQSPRKLCATSDHASTDVRRSPPGQPLGARGVVLVPGLRRERVSARLLLEAARDEEPQPGPHERDQEHAADELRERELPAEEDPDHDPELEDEVRGRELERHRRDEARALLEHRLRDRDGRVAARRRGGAEAGREGHRPQVARAEGALHARARDPGLHDPGEREAEDQRPADLPRHAEGVPETVADPAEHVHVASLDR